MTPLFRKLLAVAFFLPLGALPEHALAQTPQTAPADTTHKYENPGGVSQGKKPFLKSKGFRAAIVPAVLIGYGASTINGHGFYSSYDAHNDIRRVFGSYRTHVDDYLQWAPYLEIGGVLLAGVDSRDDRVNLALIVLKSEAIMLSTVYVMKTLTAIERPDQSNNLSFPSGHTAQAFLAASIVHTEFRDKSQWYGIGAYTIATSVAALRMINDKHWQSDVVAGAGVGILSAHLAYLSHRNRWGRKPIGREVSAVPLWSPSGGMGLSVTWRPK
ncbi:phosphatase PAP2 family protein [Hymenobacter sp. 5317J-9]|uniref:phosphatase PAP2 family protein n=1 Tax=Hymenobacter sp. 5317J-9 TaxID=2932250 RepID=UPI001FD6AD73|nr:phosphatase PAP2 family protein [Hymenobacter sp. 5317J-9]UOQ96017.1 phosphatase PAP2 family protein [Hymenobacter sp. 5317J-9]